MINMKKRVTCSRTMTKRERDRQRETERDTERESQKSIPLITIESLEITEQGCCAVMVVLDTIQ